MNRASGGKSTNQILLFPRLYKSKAPQLPPALLPTSFLSLLPSLFPHVQFYYFTQINVYICLILYFSYFFQKIEWTKDCHSGMIAEVQRKTYDYGIAKIDQVLCWFSIWTFHFYESNPLQMF